MPFLKIVKGPSRGTAFRLIDSNDIGRLTSCRIVLPEPTVSKRHAIIRKIEGVFHVEDVKSKSGTILNGKQINTPNPLKDGDRIRICDYTLAFYEHDSDQGEEEEEDDDAEESSSLVIQSVLDESSEQVLASQPAERLAMLLKLGAELTQTFDLKELLPRAVERLFAVFPQADRVFVILREAGRLISRVSKTRRPDDAGTRFSRTIVNRVLETEKSVLIEDTNSRRRSPTIGSAR